MSGQETGGLRERIAEAIRDAVHHCGQGCEGQDDDHVFPAIEHNGRPTVVEARPETLAELAEAVVQPLLDAKDAEIKRLTEVLDDNGIEQHDSIVWRVQDLGRLLRQAENERDAAREDAEDAEAERDRLREQAARFLAAEAQARVLAQQIIDSDCPGGWGYELLKILAALDQPETP